MSPSALRRPAEPQNAHPAVPGTAPPLARRWRVTGRVQGVGFRPFVRRLAARHRLTGWVRNRSGDVEILAQGEAAALAAFGAELLERAPPLARPRVASSAAVPVAALIEFVILPSEDSAEPGRWSTARAEYQRGIMDAVSNPDTEEIAIKKSAQTGGTQILLNIAGYFIHLDPSPILWVSTTIGEVEAFSKDRFEPFRRDNPVIAERIADPKSRDGDNTITDKRFAGGRLLFRGANAMDLRSACSARLK